jgi:hypothetical protein
MRLMGVVHVEAHLLDCVGNVRPDEGEVLEEGWASKGGLGEM